MTDHPTAREHLQSELDAVIGLLDREPALAALCQQQKQGDVGDEHEPGEREALHELVSRVNALAPFDIAQLLEMLRPERRRLVWNVVSEDSAGDVLWEVTDHVADDLVANTERGRLLNILRQMDADDLSQIADHVPADVFTELHATLGPRRRSWLASYATFPPGSVGRLMTHEVVVIGDQATVKDVLKLLRKLDAIPDQMDALYVVDGHDRLVGRLSLQSVLLHHPRERVADIMETDVVSFAADEDAEDVVRAFERDNLVSAPIVDDRHRLVGRLPVDEVVDFVRREAEANVLKREGLSGEEDLFAPVWRGARRRWLWLSVNLLTAFLASRIIGVFAESIEQLVALATLMPIVASVGGNTGNQTVALMVRGFALDQVNSGNIGYLARKELAISTINGLIWGGVMGLIASLLYQDVRLGLVMAAAMLLNLLVAAVCGIGVPALMKRIGRDPALGSSVLLTFTTDSMGFLIFLGLATIFLTP